MRGKPGDTRNAFLKDREDHRDIIQIMVDFLSRKGNKLYAIMIGLGAAMEHLSLYITLISYVVIAFIVFKISKRVVSKANFIKEGDRTEIALSLSIVWPMTLCFVTVYYLDLGITKIMARYKKEEANNPLKTLK